MTIWSQITKQAEEIASKEPLMKPLISEMILTQSDLAEALGLRLAEKLGEEHIPMPVLTSLFHDLYQCNPQIIKSAEKDLKAICDRDPACTGYVIPLLYYKGFLALQASRLSHELWSQDRKDMAAHIQSRNSEAFGVDIHPGATFGHGILLDHASSFVAGETAVVGNNVSILHEVTLGGSGKECGDRHPKVGNGVLIGAGAKLLGNINIGEGAKIGAGSVVLEDVCPHITVVGVPAKQVGKPRHKSPSAYMEHNC